MRLAKGLFFLLLAFLSVLSAFLLLEHLNRSGFWKRAEKTVSTAIKLEQGATPSIVLPTPTPISADFGLVIEKIGVNAPIRHVDGSNEKAYLPNILQGIGHYQPKVLPQVVVDGSLPGEGGNVFLFGHSQIPGGDLSHYKGVFNNLGQLEIGDRMTVYYQGQAYYNYEVYQSKVVDKTALSYLDRTPKETLTLMTCWPLGLDIKRYIVRARRI